MTQYNAFSKKTRRLQGYDYRWEGLYFITICTQGREAFFGEVRNSEMVLSDEGQIAHDYWLEIETHQSNVVLGEFVVMPNHVHGIIGLEGERGTKNNLNLAEMKESLLSGNPDKNEFMAALAPKSGSLAKIVGMYKASCTKTIKRISTEPFGWQPRFHDRIIRNQRELIHIENYILDNPRKWQEDQFYKPM
ncbi:MAG: transposase [Rufibacter sp.]